MTIQEIIEAWNGCCSGGGGGGYQYMEIPVTHVLPNGKTLQTYDYHIDVMDGEEYLGSLQLSNVPEVDMSTILFDGVSHILIESGTSTFGDWLMPSNISATGNITLDPDNNRSIIVSGEGTVTITWVVV